MDARAIAAEHPSATLWTQVHGMIRWLKIIFFAAVGLFFLLLLAEAARLYQTAAGVHPYLGYGSLLVAAAALVLLAIPVRRFLEMPRAVAPPSLPSAGEIGMKHLRAEVRYLSRYLACCERNPELREKAAAVREARGELARLESRIRAAAPGDLEPLSRELGDWTEETASSLLSEVDAKVERLIYQEALNVGLGTAASPNGTLDAFVMLWRSMHLVSRLAVLYYGRPGIWGTLLICRDVAVATATAAYLQNVSDSLGSVLAKSIGGVTSIVAGPAVQGVTNSLVLIRIGYLTKERCRSFRGWDSHARSSALTRALSATQKVAVGLTTEIFRKVGTGLGSVAEAAVDGLTSAAESAMSAAAGLGEKITDVFRGKKKEEKEEEDQEN